MIGEYSSIVQTGSNAKTVYTTNDHLGSPRINTDGTGQVISRHDYHPFGEEIARTGYGSDTIRKQFTGYERDGETGLDFAQARYLSTHSGRFLSVDPILMTPERRLDPQQINLYVYVRNNPYTFVDPTGEILEYSSKDAKRNLEKYQRYLEKCGEKCENELNTLNRLVKSDVTYVINLKAGKDQSETGEGELTSDGTKVFVNIDNVGGASGENYSLNTRFAHELEHARQFEDGEISFFKNNDGQWVAANYDLTDEVKAHNAMLSVASNTDYMIRDSSGKFSRSTMGNFASAKTDEERLGVIRGSSYGKKSIPSTSLNFQPHPSVSGDKKPGELVRAPSYFGRIYAAPNR